ncbi:putative 4,5-dihydroxyphthalate dehydrogenase [compost metagenome]
MKVVVIGGGAIGARHLEALQSIDGLTACAVVEFNPIRGRELADRFGIRAYVLEDDMYKQEQPDLVIIALPHHLHKVAAVRAADQGCHMLLEKPMALSVQECDEIIAAAARRGVLLMVGHTQQYLPENRKAREIIAGGELGELIMIHDVRHVDYFRPERPEWFFVKEASGGGIIANLGSHSIDKIQWLSGSPITKVKASLSFHGNRGNVEGSGMLFLETASGVPASITQSGYPGAARSETELIFTKGMLKIETGVGVFVARNGKYEIVSSEPAAEPLVLQLQELLQSIREGKDPECSGGYSRSVVAVLESAYLSYETGVEQNIRHPN